MKRAYQFCLLLYPRDLRDQFAEEMIHVFEEASAESRAQGRAWYVRFAVAEITGLIGGAARAWLDRRSAAPAPAQSPAPGWMPQELVEAQQRVDANIAAMVHAIANHQFERARLLSDKEREARENLRMLQEKYGRERYGDEYGINC
jgi:hypothetical protein